MVQVVENFRDIYIENFSQAKHMNSDAEQMKQDIISGAISQEDINFVFEGFRVFVAEMETKVLKKKNPRIDSEKNFVFDTSHIFDTIYALKIFNARKEEYLTIDEIAVLGVVLMGYTLNRTFHRFEYHVGGIVKYTDNSYSFQCVNNFSKYRFHKYDERIVKTFFQGKYHAKLLEEQKINE